MARKKSLEHDPKKEVKGESFFDLHPSVRRIVGVTGFLLVAIFLLFAAFSQGGPVGGFVYFWASKLFGLGYYLFPFVAFAMAYSFVGEDSRRLVGFGLISSFVFVLAGLGFIDIVAPGRGGFTGSLIGSIELPFGKPISLFISLGFMIMSFFITVNRPLGLGFLKRKAGLQSSGGGVTDEGVLSDGEIKVTNGGESLTQAAASKSATKKIAVDGSHKSKEGVEDEGKAGRERRVVASSYVAPPLSLLDSQVDRPTIGDLKSRANEIKRTLENFGIAVEMDQVSIGPTVTRFALRPAEGVKLSRITALNQDLALALAAHPIRIEAPIPGKSLVGIEVPNKTAAVVRLGSLMHYSDFHKSGSLTFCLGKNVSGEPVFSDLAKMPHLLIAGATGSGKSITLHTILTSFLYKNGPESLRLILVDPKRVELSMYNGVPHLVSPVITDNKKAIGALRFAIKEMDMRYNVLQEAGVRDIKSYNKDRKNEPLPYLVIVIDEMADLMSTYGREVEGLIIRLAQMARATGIHLILSTQRPSVEVITGLIKANIATRIALQVASQVDSRTILDMAGAEKLLGRGDLLFASAELSKPQRIQGAFISEDELKSVIAAIVKDNPQYDTEPVNNLMARVGEAQPATDENGNVLDGLPVAPLDFEAFGEDSDDDELYEKAVELVRSQKKASASMLQRRLAVGYARASRLIDIMEERGVVGPGDGAKPREVLM